MTEINRRPTREQFEDYVRIRDSGVTNMFALNTVCGLSNTGLTKDICIYIMRNFGDLADEFGIDC